MYRSVPGLDDEYLFRSASVSSATVRSHQPLCVQADCPRSTGMPAVVDLLDWPAEVWAEVFRNLQPRWLPIHDDFTPARLAASKQVLEYRSYHDLRLVCRKFDQIISTQPGLMTHMVFCKADPSLFLSKLLAYRMAGRHLHSLTCLTESTCMGMLLPQFFTDLKKLYVISINAANAATISCLSAFTGLMIIQLHKPAEQVLDLQPLAALSNLRNLDLVGLADFGYLYLGARLTSLSIMCGQIKCLVHDSEPLSLCNLSVICGSVQLMTEIGIAACTALTRLELQFGRTTAAEIDWYVSQAPPACVTLLVSLTNLTVALRDEVDLQHFSTLPALTRLHLLHDHASLLAGDVLGLSKLQMLVVTQNEPRLNNSWYHSPLSFAFEWEKLKALKIVKITGSALFGSSFLQLADLQELENISLLSFLPGSLQTRHLVATLSSMFAIQQQGVDVLIEHLLHGQMYPRVDTDGDSQLDQFMHEMLHSNAAELF